MNYEVFWGPIAESMLAEIWLDAPNRGFATQTAADLERKLAQDPLHLGESRASSVQRIVYQPPLGIEFEVIEDDKRVIVQGVFANPTS